MTEEFREYDEAVANTRRPLVLIVGKPLNQQELKTLIVNEEPFFQMWDKDGKDIVGEKWIYDENLELVDTNIERGYCGTLRNIVHRKGFCWLDGWLFCDGTIYGSFYEFKYPDYTEYIDKWELLAQRNPFVDMVVAYTDINESPCYACKAVDAQDAFFDEICKGTYYKDEEFYGKNRGRCPRYSSKCLLRNLPDTRRKAFVKSYEWCAKTMKHKKESKDSKDMYKQRFYQDMSSWMIPMDIHKQVRIALHIHDGIVDTLWGDAAGKLYANYDDRYGDFRLWITHNSDFYALPFNGGTGEDIVFVKFDDEYMRDCFRFMGLSEKIYDEQIKPKYLIDIKSKKQVVTREWLLSEYDKHFKDTELDIENVNRFLRK